MAVWVDAAKFAQAMRKIVESVKFWNMRPVRDDGSEYDDLVMQGPVPEGNWQVITEEGVSYIVFFWGTIEERDVNISLTPGSYSYSWYDTREWKSPLSSGTISGTTVPRPASSSWNSDAGVVLVIKK